VALRYNPRLRSVYKRITASSKGRRKVAIVAVARRMLVIAWAMMRDGTEWDASKQNHVNCLASIDFFTVYTVRFRILYCFVVLCHERRRVVHCSALVKV